MNTLSLKGRLQASLKRQRRILKGSIVLNPVDSMPIYHNEMGDADFLEGFYVTDRPRDDEGIANSKIFFAGRRASSLDCKLIYDSWADALGCEELSMRLLSGLHAHVTLFMGIGGVGDTVLLLPEMAGGHFATAGILKRLGYNVIDLPVDLVNRCVDIKASLKLIETSKAKFLFIDRSEGLSYEDFSQLACHPAVYSIFDASQYMPAILTGVYESPFDMGFDLIISTLHKSFPGPQKALIASRCNDDMWKLIQKAMSSYVSSSHIRSTYLAGFGLGYLDQLKKLANNMLNNSVVLEDGLVAEKILEESRSATAPPTQHIWIPCGDKDDAFAFYKDLERCRIYCNYRLLPYGLGYGLRLGTTLATFLGMRKSHAVEMSAIIKEVRTYGFSLKLRHRVRALAEEMYGEEEVLQSILSDEGE